MAWVTWDHNMTWRDNNMNDMTRGQNDTWHGMAWRDMMRHDRNRQFLGAVVSLWYVQPNLVPVLFSTKYIQFLQVETKESRWFWNLAMSIFEMYSMVFDFM